MHVNLSDKPSNRDRATHTVNQATTFSVNSRELGTHQSSPTFIIQSKCYFTTNNPPRYIKCSASLLLGHGPLIRPLNRNWRSFGNHLSIFQIHGQWQSVIGLSIRSISVWNLSFTVTRLANYICSRCENFREIDRFL